MALFTVLLVGVMIATARAEGRIDDDLSARSFFSLGKLAGNSVKALEYNLDLSLLDDFAAVGGKVDILVELVEPMEDSKDEVEEMDNKKHEFSIPVRVNAKYDVTRIELKASDSIDGLGENIEPVIPMERSEDGELVTIVMDSSAGSFGRISIHFEGPKSPDGIMLRGNGQSEPGQACDLFPCLANHSLNDQAKIQVTVSRPESPRSRVAILAPIKSETSFEMDDGSKFLRTEFEPQQTAVNTFGFFVGNRCYGDCSSLCEPPLGRRLSVV